MHSVLHSVIRKDRGRLRQLSFFCLWVVLMLFCFFKTLFFTDIRERIIRSSWGLRYSFDKLLHISEVDSSNSNLSMGSKSWWAILPDTARLIKSKQHGIISSTWNKRLWFTKSWKLSLIMCPILSVLYLWVAMINTSSWVCFYQHEGKWKQDGGSIIIAYFNSHYEVQKFTRMTGNLFNFRGPKIGTQMGRYQNGIIFMENRIIN